MNWTGVLRVVEAVRVPQRVFYGENGEQGLMCAMVKRMSAKRAATVDAGVTNKTILTICVQEGRLRTGWFLKQFMLNVIE